VQAVMDCKNDRDVKQIGIDWCIQQCRELIEFGVPILHFYTMSKSESTRKIAAAIF
jgi:methylenetetrahydrofolate reductase (NADPH)